MDDPLATRTPRPALFVAVGGTARRLLDASGALRDYPRCDGREQARHLHLDTDRAGVPDAATLQLRASRRPEDAVAAAERECQRLHQRLLDDALALVRGDDDAGHDGAVLDVYVVAWTGRASGGWPLLATLQAAQRLKEELAGWDVEVERRVLLTLPSIGDERHADMLVQSTAVLLALEAASRFGVDVVAGRRLVAPIAEWAVVVGQGPGVPVGLDTQLRQAGAVLRVLADQGPLGQAVRRHMEAMPRPEPIETPIFSIGIGSMVLERERAIDLLTGRLLAMGDEAQADRQS
jgi:hypothetical protein